MKINKFIYLLVVPVIIVLFNCNDDSVNNNNSSNGNIIDPTILHTDSFGIPLGGDTTDWCIRGINVFSFNAAYPNPTYDTFKIGFNLPVTDTVSLYFLNTNTDTVFVINKAVLNAGTYETRVSSQALNYNYVTKRIYIKTYRLQNNDPYCRQYGDIQFY